jgi:glutamyl-tRNA synthetase
VERYLGTRGYDLAGRDAQWRLRFVRALGDRLRTLADAETYGAFALHAGLAYEPEALAALRARAGAPEHLRALADRLGADSEFSLASLEAATRALAAERGVKAGELIAAARIALTGRTVSPGIFDVMALLGRECTVARLRAAAEACGRAADERPAAG